MSEQILNENLLTLSQVLRLLNIPKHRLVYLFDSRRLKSEEFLTMPNGHKVFTESDLGRIKKALFEVGTK